MCNANLIDQPSRLSVQLLTNFSCLSFSLSLCVCVLQCLIFLDKPEPTAEILETLAKGVKVVNTLALCVGCIHYLSSTLNL